MLKIAQENEFDFLSQEYASLRARAATTAFQHPVWLNEFYRHLPENRGADPLIVTVRDGAQSLCAVVPLIKRTKLGVTLLETTDLGVSDYAAPIIDPDAVGEMASLRGDIKRAIGRYDLLRIRPIRDEHVALWQAVFDGDAVVLEFSAHAVALTPPYEDWRKSHLDAKIAGQTARKWKRWQKQAQVELKLCEGESEIRSAIAKLASLRSGRFEGDPIQDGFVENFYADVAVHGADGLAQTWIMTSDGEIAGIVFGLGDQGRFCYLLIGCDYDGYGRHSPGFQMYEGIIQRWMDAGGEQFDFTIGDEPFKSQFGATPTPMFALIEGASLKGKIAAGIMKRQLTSKKDQEVKD